MPEYLRANSRSGISTSGSRPPRLGPGLLDRGRVDRPAPPSGGGHCGDELDDVLPAVADCPPPARAATNLTTCCPPLPTARHLRETTGQLAERAGFDTAALPSRHPVGAEPRLENDRPPVDDHIGPGGVEAVHDMVLERGGDLDGEPLRVACEPVEVHQLGGAVGRGHHQQPLVGVPGSADTGFALRIEPREVARLSRVEVDQPHIEVRHGRAGEVGQDDGQPGRYRGLRHTAIVASFPPGFQFSSRVQGPPAGQSEAAPCQQPVTINGRDLGNSGRSNARLCQSHLPPH